jgi:hypothetical protein
LPRVAAPKPTATTPSTPAEPSVVVPQGLDVRSKMYVLLGALAGRVDFAAELLSLVAQREFELQQPRGE